MYITDGIFFISHVNSDISPDFGGRLTPPYPSSLLWLTLKMATKRPPTPPSGDEKVTEIQDGPTLDFVSSVETEKALLRKIDLRLIPVIMLLYLFSFLDRGESEIINLGSEYRLIPQKLTSGMQSYTG